MDVFVACIAVFGAAALVAIVGFVVVYAVAEGYIYLREKIPRYLAGIIDKGTPDQKIEILTSLSRICIGLLESRLKNYTVGFEWRDNCKITCEVIGKDLPELGVKLTVTSDDSKPREANFNLIDYYSPGNTESYDKFVKGLSQADVECIKVGLKCMLIRLM